MRNQGVRLLGPFSELGWRPWLLPIGLAVFLVFVSFQNFLLFHFVAELFAIVIGVLMCVVAWHTYPFSRDSFLMYLGCGYFWIAVLDGVHALVYKGMSIFPIAIANPATQFWIASRYSEALLLLTVPLFLDRAIAKGRTFFGFGVVAAVLYVLIMTGNFPDAYIEGQGLTPFKVSSEYVIIALLAGALIFFVGRRKSMEPSVFALLAGSIIVTMMAELAFTFYVSVYGLSNLIGHIFKLFSFWMIFMAVVRQSLKEPYLELERRVEARTSDLQAEIAERIQAEDALRDAKVEAEMANRAKSEALANMSHELRTPLNAIIGFSGSIQAETFGSLENEKYREYIGDISDSGQHLLKLIEDILDVSAIEAGMLELREESLKVRDLVYSSIRVVGHRADQGKVRLTTDIDEGLPLLFADDRRMKQIFINLLSNAIKFTEPLGHVSLTATLDARRGHVFTVTDTGIGMDEEGLAEAMTPFGQVDPGLARKHEGTGLGLPLTRELVELHGGTLEIVSARGEGTTVTVRFPSERVAPR